MSEGGFLAPRVEHIKKSIEDIDDSYNNPWDVLAELCQNAVDAIRLANPPKPKILISVNCATRRISVADNGIGIPSNQIAEVLRPFATYKAREERTIGEKGVGLTFAMFQSNKFSIESRQGKSSYRIDVTGCRAWKDSSDENFPLPKLDGPTESSREDGGTTVILEDTPDLEIYKLTTSQLEFVLRTRTAIGHSLAIWGDTSEQVSIELVHVDQDGASTSRKVAYRHRLVTDQLSKSTVIRLRDFRAQFGGTSVSDEDKRAALHDKVIVEYDEIQHTDNRRIRYYAIFVPNRGIWDKVSIDENLVSEELIESENFPFPYAVHQAGIFLSVKGMPTGISVERPTTGYAGYWHNMFILFEDGRLRFDIGRKSVHGQQARIYREHAKGIFNNFLKDVSRYVSGDIETENDDWSIEAIIEQLRNRHDLGIHGFPFGKTPLGEEASVAAIFFLAMGKGLISNIDPILAGYRNRYDLYAKVGGKTKIVEFKARLRNVLKDFSDTTKLFNEIDCIVCWDVSDDDKAKMHDHAITLIEGAGEGASGNAPKFPHATHTMRIPNSKPVFVIDLKKVLT